MPLKFNWENILELAVTHGLPRDKKRAILREYLQCQFLDLLYSQPAARQLSFIGGTSLRLLRGLDRFSEDLDFDNPHLKTKELLVLFRFVHKRFTILGLTPELHFKAVTPSNWRGEIRFGQSLLNDLGISSYRHEKLMIKVELAKPQWITTLEAITLNRFGVIQVIVTNSLPTILSQKTLAALYRRSTRARDFYDIVWLLSQQVRPNFATLQAEKITNMSDYKNTLLHKFEQIKPNLPRLKVQLLPFLINPEKIKYIDIFGEIIGGL